MIPRIRQQYPQYQDMTDDDLMIGLHRKYYSDMPYEHFYACCGRGGDNGQEEGRREEVLRPDHDNLEDCAVRGADSLNLQNLDPSVKPVVKMTYDELPGPMPGKISVVLEDGTTYVIDPAAIDPSEAMEAIVSGEDSEILGYPERGPMDAAVTKQGEVVTDLPMMRSHAEAGNVVWAANGQSRPLMQKAQNVATAIRRG